LALNSRMETTDNPAGTGEAKAPTPEAGPETPAARDKRGRFQKGAPSANPKGRPTESREMKELARDKSKEAIARLVYWMRSGDPTASIAAAKELLNRGYGRPEQGITLDATVAQKRTYPSMRDMDANDASQAYADFIRSPAGSVEFAEPVELSPEEAYAQMMRIGSEDDRRFAERALAGRTFRELVDAGRKLEEATLAPGRPALAPPLPKARAEPPEPVQAATFADPPAAGPSERSSAPRAPSPVDPDDPSVIAVVDARVAAEDEALRSVHFHKPLADSICPGCRHLWVIS
jgi:hypothetical protein